MMIGLIGTALITPSVGLKLYVVQGARGKRKMSEVMLGTLPFIAVMLAMVAALIAFPQIALYLPDAVR